MLSLTAYQWDSTAEDTALTYGIAYHANDWFLFISRDGMSFCTPAMTGDAINNFNGTWYIIGTDGRPYSAVPYDGDTYALYDDLSGAPTGMRVTIPDIYEIDLARCTTPCLVQFPDVWED